MLYGSHLISPEASSHRKTHMQLYKLPRKSFVRFRRWSHCRWAALSLVLVCLFDHKPAIFQNARCYDLCGSVQGFYRLCEIILQLFLAWVELGRFGYKMSYSFEMLSSFLSIQKQFLCMTAECDQASMEKRMLTLHISSSYCPGGAHTRTTGCSHRCSKSSTANATVATHFIGLVLVWEGPTDFHY